MSFALLVLVLDDDQDPRVYLLSVMAIFVWPLVYPLAWFYMQEHQKDGTP